MTTPPAAAVRHTARLAILLALALTVMFVAATTGSALAQDVNNDTPLLTAAPTTAGTGDTLTVSATGCPGRPDAPNPRVDFRIFKSGVGSVVGDAPSVNGIATTTLVVPEAFISGGYAVGADCNADLPAQDLVNIEVFEYEDTFVTIVQSEFAESLTVNRTSLSTGETLELRANGCPSIDNDVTNPRVDFALAPLGGEPTTTTAPATDGAALGSIVIPPEMTTGTYYWSASCVGTDAAGDDVALFDYRTSTVQVRQIVPEPELSATANETPVITVGSSFRLLATGCPRNTGNEPSGPYGVTLELQSIANAGEEPAYSRTIMTRQADFDSNLFGTTWRIPDSAPSGTYILNGTCNQTGGPGPVPHFEYDELRFNVAPEGGLAPFECASDAGVLTWTDHEVNKYWIYKSTDDGATYNWIGRTTGATTFEDLNAQAGSLYRVHYQGIPQIDCTITSEPGNELPPFECASDAGVLTWSDHEVNKYWIYRSTDDGATYNWIGRTTGATTFEDLNAQAGSLYRVHYQGIPQIDCTITSEPGNGPAFECELTRNVLEWTNADAEKYWIYRSADGVNFQWAGRTFGRTTFVVPPAENGPDSYTYEVHYEGLPRTTCSANPEDVRPTITPCLYDRTTGDAELRWMDFGEGVTYNVTRRLNGEFTRIAEGLTSQFFEDSSPPAGVSYEIGLNGPVGGTLGCAPA